MVSCEDVLRELSNYIDNDIDAQLRSAIEQHLSGCHRCSVLLDSTRKILFIYADENVIEVPAGYTERLHAFLRRALSAQ